MTDNVKIQQHSDLSYALLMHSCALAQINMSRGIFCLRAMYGPKFTGPGRAGPGPAGPGLRAARPVQTSIAHPRTEQCGSAVHISRYRRRSSDVRRQRMARFHRGVWRSQRINSVIDRARRIGYCSPDTPTFDEMCDIADDELFSKAVQLSDHVLHPLLQSSTS